MFRLVTQPIEYLLTPQVLARDKRKAPLAVVWQRGLSVVRHMARKNRYFKQVASTMRSSLAPACTSPALKASVGA